MKQNTFKPIPNAYVLPIYEPQRVAKILIQDRNQVQSFYIFDMDEAYKRIQHLKQMIPRVKILYEMRTNHTPMMLKLAISQDIGFCCASPTEVYKLRQLNVNPRDVIYSTPIKSTSHMKYANATGLQHTVFDSSIELKNLMENWPDARLLLGIRVTKEDTVAETKFGCDYESEAFGLLDEAAALGMKVVGVCFYGGEATNTYIDGLRHAKALFEHEAQNGRQMKIVYITGFNDVKTDRIDEVSKLINDAIENLFPDPSIQIMAQLCNYIAESAFTLYCSIITVAKSVRNDGKSVNMTYLNDGVFETMRYLEDSQKITKLQLENEVTSQASESEESILWGPSCHSRDRLLADTEIRLPGCNSRDWIVFSSHGANSLVYGSKFSSIPVPLIQPAVSMKLWNILKNSRGFEPEDFTLEKTSQLPSTWPAIQPKTECPYTKTYTLRT